jgi:hypothetical protein
MALIHITPLKKGAPYMRKQKQGEKGEAKQRMLRGPLLSGQGSTGLQHDTSLLSVVQKELGEKAGVCDRRFKERGINIQKKKTPTYAHTYIYNERTTH